MPNYVGSGIGGAIQPGVDPWNPYKAEQIRLDLNDHEDGLADHEVRIIAIEGGAIGDLNDLSDVVITTPAVGHVLKYIASGWVNGALPLDDLSDVTLATPIAGDGLAYSGSVWANVPMRRRVVVTLTDAQVKALPTTPILTLAAPGSNKYINIEYVLLQAKFSAGAYTNINATYASLALAIGSGGLAAGAGPVQGITKDTSTTPAMTALTTFLGAANRQVKLMPYAEAVPVAAAVGYFVPTFDGSYNMDLFTALNNIAVYISADNNSSGNFTGGNAANTLKVVMYYTIEDVP